MVDPDFATKYNVKNNGLVNTPGPDSDVSILELLTKYSLI